MKKVNQKIKSAVNVNVVNNNNIHTRAAHLMLASLLGLCLVYVLVLVNMVWKVVERKALEADAHNLSSQVADLELTYLNLSHQVDSNMSNKMGFYEVKPTFATASANAVGTIVKVSNEI